MTSAHSNYCCFFVASNLSAHFCLTPHIKKVFSSSSLLLFLPPSTYPSSWYSGWNSASLLPHTNVPVLWLAAIKWISLPTQNALGAQVDEPSQTKHDVAPCLPSSHIAATVQKILINIQPSGCPWGKPGTQWRDYISQRRCRKWLPMRRRSESCKRLAMEWQMHIISSHRVSICLLMCQHGQTANRFWLQNVDGRKSNISNDF